MKFNKAGLDLIKRFEGCKLKAYSDVGGIWTIGWGSTCNRTVFEGMEITQGEADAMLDDDCASIAGIIRNMVPANLTDNQFSALVCFAYNEGPGRLRSSTLLQLIEKGDFEGAADEFLKWVRVNGKFCKGLLNRRQAERILFLS